jgi:hypothetical protein
MVVSGSRDRAGTRRTARLIALAGFLVFAFTGGGRIVGSDEVTMFELSRSMLNGRIDVPPGATLQGPDGRSYTKNTAGQAVLALPLVGFAEVAATVGRFREERAVLAERFVTSFFNAGIAAITLASLYAFSRRLGVRPGAALAAVTLLGLTTPFWVYAKSFMAEPLEALGLLMVIGNGALASAGGERPLPDENKRLRFAAVGAFIAISAKASMLLPVLAGFIALGPHRPRRVLVPMGGVALALALQLVYNFARFHDVLQSGYGAQASAAGFSTPLPVGLYGLLFSSGKGILWFAPAIWLAFAGYAEMRRPRSHTPEPRHGAPASYAALAVAWVWAASLLEFGSFQHWAGDGSWGPRYLVPMLPAAFLLVAFALEGASRARRRIAWALGIAGLIVTLGGVGIYFGAEMREVGDYPYTLPLEHPRFMESSHFNPRFSPITVHWRMLGANATRHALGLVPVLGRGGPVDPRLGISAADQQALLRAIDVWWLYALYAGMDLAPLATVALLLLAAAIAAAHAARRSAAAEEPRAA